MRPEKTLKKTEENEIVNRNEEGELIGDVTESNGFGETAWGTTGDLTPEEAAQSGGEGYNSGPETFVPLPDEAGKKHE